MTAQDHIEYIKDRASAHRNGFILGKHSVDPESVTAEEWGQFDTKFIDPVRDEHD